MEKLGKASATTTVASTEESSSRARKAAAIPASLPPITSSRIVTVPGRRASRSGAGWHQLAQELLDAGVDVVADAPDHLDRLAGRVLEFPVLIALAWIDRAGIPAAHGDDGVGGADELVAQGLGNSLDRSMPHSFIAAMTDGLSWSPG